MTGGRWCLWWWSLVLVLVVVMGGVSRCGVEWRLVCACAAVPHTAAAFLNPTDEEDRNAEPNKVDTVLAAAQIGAYCDQVWMESYIGGIWMDGWSVGSSIAIHGAPLNTPCNTTQHDTTRHDTQIASFSKEGFSNLFLVGSLHKEAGAPSLEEAAAAAGVPPAGGGAGGKPN